MKEAFSANSCIFTKKNPNFHIFRHFLKQFLHLKKNFAVTNFELLQINKNEYRHINFYQFTVAHINTNTFSMDMKRNSSHALSIENTNKKYSVRCCLLKKKFLMPPGKNAIIWYDHKNKMWTTIASFQLNLCAICLQNKSLWNKMINDIRWDRVRWTFESVNACSEMIGIKVTYLDQIWWWKRQKKRKCHEESWFHAPLLANQRVSLLCS